MFFTAKLASVLLAIAVSAQASDVVTARSELAELSVTFWDDVNFTGQYYTAGDLVQGRCYDLGAPGFGPESLVITPGYTCAFFVEPACVGTGVPLSGSVAVLPNPLFNNIESFSCIQS